MPSNRVLKEALNDIEQYPSKVLGLNVNGKAVTMKQYIPRAEAQSPPKLSFAVFNTAATYVAVGIDLDAPFPWFNVAGPMLHWIQPGFKAVGEDNQLISNEPFIVNYIAPAPPPGSAPHRYVFLIFEQPTDFDAKKFAPADGQSLGVYQRMRYSLDAWQNEAELGDPEAANYFLSN